MFWLSSQSVIFLESFQLILDKLNPETKQREAKILFLRSTQTFKVLMEDLQFLRSFWIPFCANLKAQKQALMLTVTRWINHFRNQRLVSLPCYYLSSSLTLKPSCMRLKLYWAIQTFKLLIELLQFLWSFLIPVCAYLKAQKQALMLIVTRRINPSKNQRLVSLSCCYFSSNNSL